MDDGTTNFSEVVREGCCKVVISELHMGQALGGWLTVAMQYMLAERIMQIAHRPGMLPADI